MFDCISSYPYFCESTKSVQLVVIRSHLICWMQSICVQQHDKDQGAVKKKKIWKSSSQGSVRINTYARMTEATHSMGWVIQKEVMYSWTNLCMRFLLEGIENGGEMF